ncbi:MAG: accessory factor UbiK family protein [Azoarcus sp.]|jgi:BMFP domain-containing protein YqiC|nr:accessory factor UbiK family protein [Azoarcus sp.]
MNTPRLIDEIGSRLDEAGAKLAELAANSPVRDIEKNVKAVLAGVFGKLDLISREEFDVQRALLDKALERLAVLEARVAALEAAARGESPES